MNLRELPEMAAKTLDRSSRAIADRIHDIQDGIGVPDAVERIPEQIAEIPGRIPSIPGQVAAIPGQLANVPGQIADIPGQLAERLDDWRRPKRQAASPATGLALLAGLALGMAAMWFLDPERGAFRRRLLADKLNKWLRRGGRAARGVTQDISNRQQGAVAEVSARVTEETVDDDILVERVRSQMGRVVSQTGRIDVTASEGRVTLSGYVPSGEVDRLLAEVSAVRGVREVENRLQVEEASGAAREGEWSQSGGGLEFSRES